MPAVIVVVLVLALTAGGGTNAEESSATPTAATAKRADRFDSARAWKHLRYQVGLGPRPAGSPELAELAGYLRARIPRGHYESVPGHPGLRNVVGRIPGKKPAVVLAAHYDTKSLPGFVGANDGAGGTAAVLEISRALRKLERPKGAPEIRIVFFDGEEATDDSRPFEATALRGSRAYAARHAKEIRALVLLDFVAEKGAMRIPREAGSDARIWRRLRAAAKRVGSLEAFPDLVSGEVTDDHTPFARKGIPAVDLIDFTFPCWHKTCDDLSAVSERSLDLSGEAVLELLRTWR
ncbi:MAG: Zn-dependent exopeptidase M28 [Thermoleophilia bacterium]|nr:Zn-dependent exopeptidase M28 [Thermoleophilia bacterium]